MLILRKLSKYITDEVNITYTLGDPRQQKGRRLNTNFIGISYGLNYSGIIIAFDIILNNGVKNIVYSASDVLPIEIYLIYQNEYILVIELGKKTSVLIEDKYQIMFGLPDRKRINVFDIGYHLIRKKKLKLTIIDEEDYEKYFDTKYPIAARNITI